MKCCTKCQIEFNDNVDFCSHCGNILIESNLQYICPRCNQMLGSSFENFCPHCGQQLNSAQSPTNESTQCSSKKYLVIVATIAVLIVGYLGFKQNLINNGYINPNTATEFYEYSLYLKDNSNEELSKKHLIIAAEKGYAKAQVDIACIENKKGNFKEAFIWLNKAAVQNDAEAIAMLAGFYLGQHEFIPQDLDKAFELYEKSSNMGNDYATMMTGLSYCYGLGRTKNTDKGIPLLEKVANNTNSKHKVQSQFILGQIYSEIKNPNKSIYWFKKAYENGHIAAIDFIGKIYEFDPSCKNYHESFKWYTLGAEKGIDQPMNGLARAYYYGRGVAKDTDKFKYWISKGDKAPIKQKEIETKF